MSSIFIFNIFIIVEEKCILTIVFFIKNINFTLYFMSFNTIFDLKIKFN